MSDLHTLQTKMKLYLETGVNETIIADIVDTQPMSASRRLNVYYEAYYLRLHEVLQVDYPKVEVLMGPDDFYEACLLYTQRYPSHHFSVRFFGQYFEKFLKETAPYADHPVLAEMANFEWSLSESIDAADAPIATVASLAKIASEHWGYLTFTFHPSVHDRIYTFNIAQIWKAIESDQPPCDIIQIEPQSWVFWRQGIRLMFESLSPHQKILYPMIRQGYNFGDMAERLCDIVEEEGVPEILLQNLQYWIESGLISHIKDDL